MLDRRARIALYSHDTMGLGHMRRNLLVAHALTKLTPAPTILMLFGAREAANYALPPGVESVTLPAFAKGTDGGYRARTLDVSIDGLVQLRSNALQAVLGAFSPDLLIVDKVARGALGELEPTLAMLRRRHRTRIVLGLRDLLDEAETVRREWADDHTVAAIRSYYDAVWVYGDRRVCDPVVEYDLPPDAALKVAFTGYLDPRARWSAPGQPPLAPPDHPYALCMVGGGQDGDAVARAFAAARRPEGLGGVIVTGPFLSAETRGVLDRARASDPGLVVHGFVADPAQLIAGATRVVAMGGYNTVTELLAYGKPALVVPRVAPRTEQLLRAERMERMGLLQVLHPERLSPAALSAWLAQPGGTAPAAAAQTLDFGGIGQVTSMAAQLLQVRPRRIPVQTFGSEWEVQRVAV